MAAVTQRSFSGGEIAPSLYARTDMQKYATGLRVCRNMMVQKHGGVTNRPGTEFLTEVKNSANAVRLIKFERSKDVAYVLEFGDQYVRMLRDGSYVQGVSLGAWVFPHVYFAGEIATSGGINYVNLTENNPNVAPGLNPTDWYPLTGLIYELPTPYLSADLPQIRHAQRSGPMLSPGGLFRGNATIMTLVHPSYAPRELNSRADAIWYLHTLSFAPSIGPPVGPIVLGGGAAGAMRYWAVTAIADPGYGGEESLVLTGSAVNRIPSAGTPTTLAWNAPAAGFPPVFLYKIYRSEDGASFGLIGTSNTLGFSDAGNVADMLSSPPGVRIIFDVADKYPTAVTHYQQRLIFGNTNAEQETIWGSKTNKFTNFSVSFPLQEDDAVTFTMVGKKLNPIQHLLDLGRLIAFTAGEEKMVEGDDAGVLRPDAINPRKLSSNGSSNLPPIEIDDSALYQQARGTIIRDMKPVRADFYEGTDLTVFAAHLFQKYSLVDWDYAQNPNSIVWVARSDGSLLGLTYLREHAIWGWHRHDTDGEVENVCVVPEGAEDKVYLVVRRTINGSVKRYIERMATRTFSDETRAIFMDACYPSDLAFANVPVARTYTLTGGVAWTFDELLTVTRTVGPVFVVGDVGNSIFFTAADGTELEFVLENFTSADVMTGHPRKTVPVDLRGLATSNVIKGTRVVTGLAHLEGKQVSVYADGYVVASPNNSDPVAGYPVLTVVGGQITLPRAYKFVRVGLPFISDVVTLDLDLPGGQTIKDRKLLANRLGIYIEASRGVWAGSPDQPTDADPLNGLQEYKARFDENYSDPVAPKTDFIDINIQARWDENGRIMVRQVDPLPLTVLSITPIGYL